MSDEVSIGLGVVASAFAAFLFLKLLGSVKRTRDQRDDDALARYRATLDRARRTRGHLEKAAAFRDASRIALDSMLRPNLAASLARRADRLNPEQHEGIELLVRSMTEGGRLRALERLLWRKLKEVEPGSDRHRWLFAELLGLYGGPLKDPDRAEALRRLYPS